MTLTTYGQQTVARWCGVTPQTVANWIRRYDDDAYPAPDVEVRNGRNVVRGWLPGREPEWRRYAALQAAKPGAALVALRRDRKGG